MTITIWSVKKKGKIYFSDILTYNCFKEPCVFVYVTTANPFINSLKFLSNMLILFIFPIQIGDQTCFIRRNDKSKCLNCCSHKVSAV